MVDLSGTAALLVGLVAYKLVRGPRDPLYLLAVREDSLVEWLTALAYLAVMVTSWILCRRFHAARRYVLSGFYLLLAGSALFVALEEISYGQRLLGFEAPAAVATRNVQREMTLHNLDFVERVFLSVMPLAAGLFGLLGFVLPALRRRIGRPWAWQLSFIVPPWFLSSWFVPIALFALYATFSWDRVGLIGWQDQEPLEALLAFGFLALVLGNLARVQRGAAGSGTRGSTHGSASEQPISS